MHNLIESSSSNARFILTANYPNKIIPALHSRCSGFHIETLDKTEFTAAVATILLEQNVEFGIETLDNFVSATYPDMRKCINLLQNKSMSGRLQAPSEEDQGTNDYKLEAISLFKKGDYLTARKLICAQIAQNEYEDMFRFMYQNIGLWAGDDIDKESEAIIIIRNGLVKHATVADLEINLSATLCELEMLAKR
jgi:replication factor C small subunit